MEIDKTTYEDLSIFGPDEESSVFHKLNYTRTSGGRHWLMQFFRQPFSNHKQIAETQRIITLILDRLADWPASISNGTVMVMEKFYETSDEIPSGHDFLNTFTYKIFHGPDFSLTRYSLAHFADFVRGMHKLTELLGVEHAPVMLQSFIQRARSLLTYEEIRSLIKKKPGSPFSASQIVYYGYFIRNRYKQSALELIDIYGRLDAWYSMALATREMHFVLPVFLEKKEPHIRAVGLYHFLLQEPVAYDIQLDEMTNFLFMTGANMAGKSTFIKAVGAAVYLAHLGMGVPAASMELSLFDGILSNINVTDNVVKGESYFFNEVQRIKTTILKINDHRNWLVLIDELFKGTNVQDAMKCSSTVIRGLIKIRNSLFILSTHLYEIGDELKAFPNILFKYFETSVKEDQLQFSYHLKEGISNDRLGYLILKREKVVDLLENL
jgi:DNA mismatch repair ATPase MutS